MRLVTRTVSEHYPKLGQIPYVSLFLLTLTPLPYNELRPSKTPLLKSCPGRWHGIRWKLDKEGGALIKGAPENLLDISLQCEGSSNIDNPQETPDRPRTCWHPDLGASRALEPLVFAPPGHTVLQRQRGLTKPAD